MKHVALVLLVDATVYNAHLHKNPLSIYIPLSPLYC